jgi:hypothetical protein
MNFTVARVHGLEKVRVDAKQDMSLPLKRGTIYVYRTVVGDNNKLVQVPLKLDKQHSYKEWSGCWSAL